LTARWANLVLLTYEAPPDLLRRYVHPSLELDRWDGRSHLSLVVFDFEDTRVRGFRVPGFVNFPEVNLRTYVRHGSLRGVVFIREFVPSAIVAAVARTWYNEPYRSAPMTSEVRLIGDKVEVERSWYVGGDTHRVRIVGGERSRPASESIEHHFKEHDWGFGRSRSGHLLSYRVEHPVWEVRAIRSLHLHVDFARAYGPEWDFLNGQEPASRMLAVGSDIAVYPPEINLNWRS
jgi:uncharacterized protein YqjF (DUF2071 family)